MLSKIIRLARAKVSFKKFKKKTNLIFFNFSKKYEFFFLIIFLDFGFVEFEKIKEAKAAVQQKNHQLNGHLITCSPFDEQSKRKQKKKTPQTREPQQPKQEAMRPVTQNRQWNKSSQVEYRLWEAYRPSYANVYENDFTFTPFRNQVNWNQHTNKNVNSFQNNNYGTAHHPEQPRNVQQNFSSEFFENYDFLEGGSSDESFSKEKGDDAPELVQKTIDLIMDDKDF